MDYMKIIDGEVDDLVSILKEKFKKYFVSSFVNNFTKCKLYEILKKMAFEDYEIYTYKDRVLNAYIDNNKKYLLISNRISNSSVCYPTHKINRIRDTSYINYSNIDFYDTEIEERKQFIYELLDEVTNNKRNYYNHLIDIDLNKYDSIIYLNDLEYIDCFDYVYKKNHIREKNIFMVCKYSSISIYTGNFNEIGRILIDNSKAYIEYPIIKDNKKEKTVNLKEISTISDTDLKDIINSTKQMDTISINISHKDFLDHAHRIGFTTYTENNVSRDKILRLIDYNKIITNKIDNLNEEIALQIDKLFVK